MCKYLYFRAAQSSELWDREVVGALGVELVGEALDVDGGPLPAAAGGTENRAEARGLHLLRGIEGEIEPTLKSKFKRKLIQKLEIFDPV